MKTRALWQTASVGDILTVRSGYAVKSSDYSQEGVPLIRQSDINGDIIDVSEAKRVPARVMEECSSYLVRDGDLLIGMSGSLGKIGRYTGSEPAIQNQRTGLLLLKPGFSSGFAKLVLKFVEQQIVAEGKGVAVQNVSAKEIEACTFPLPPKEERDEIVAEIEKQFTRLEVGVAALRRVQANLRRYRVAVLKAACEGRLVPTEAELFKTGNRKTIFETGEALLARVLTERRQDWQGRGKYKEPAASETTKLHALPDGWTWASIEQVSTKVVDGVHKKPNYVPSGIPFVTVRNLTAGPGISFGKLKYITPEDHEEFIKRANPEPGDILVSKDGTLGVVRVINTDVKFSIFVSVAMVKPVLRDMSKFLGIALSAPQVQVQMVPKGSGLQHIHLEDLREDCIPLPPLLEQKRIVAEVERRLSVVEELESVVSTNLRRATRLRQSILQAAFIGRRL